MQFNRNDIKLSFERPIYSINEKKGKVVCVLNYRIILPTGGDEETSNNLNFLLFANPWDNENKAVGVAVCGPKDKFNEKTGMEVAEARAESLAYIQANKKIDKAFRLLSEYVYKWQSDFDTKACKVVKHNAEYIKRVG